MREHWWDLRVTVGSRTDDLDVQCGTHSSHSCHLRRVQVHGQVQVQHFLQRRQPARRGLPRRRRLHAILSELPQLFRDGRAPIDVAFIPDSVLLQLADRGDIGIHTGMLSDGMAAPGQGSDELRPWHEASRDRRRRPACKSIRERAQALIHIAHLDCRESLVKGLVYRSSEDTIDAAPRLPHLLRPPSNLALTAPTRRRGGSAVGRWRGPGRPAPSG